MGKSLAEVTGEHDFLVQEYRNFDTVISREFANYQWFVVAHFSDFVRHIKNSSDSLFLFSESLSPIGGGCARIFKEKSERI